MNVRTGVLVLLSVLFGGRPAEGSVQSAPKNVTVDRVEIEKGAHTITLFAKEQVVFKTSVAIGPGGAGPKLREGDKVTPVGRYRIVSKGPSRFRTFMGIDYPNAEDRRRFAKLKAEGQLPKAATIGGDIGIHGPLPNYEAMNKLADWTLGCIAVDPEEIDLIARITPVGTVVEIRD